MPITGVTGVSPNNASTSVKPGGELGKDEFLNLLVKQLQAQDPLNPMDSSEFISQLAQFSSLEQLQNINDKLDDTTSNISGAANLVGQEVEALGNQITVENGVSGDIYFELTDEATGVYATISDSNGVYIKSIPTGPMSAGYQTVTWDGADDNGKTVSDGMYTVDIQAVGTDGNAVEVTSFIKGKVTGATFKDGMTYLLLGNNAIPLNSVTKITQSTTNPT